MKIEYELICELLKSHRYFSRFSYIETHYYPILGVTGFYLRKDPNQWAQVIFYDPGDLTLALKIKNRTRFSVSDPECLDKLAFLMEHP